MGPLRLVTYLGLNTEPIARALAEHLGSETGVAVEAMTSLPLDEISDSGADLYWMCGLLTTELLDSGAVDGEIVAAPVFPGHDGPVYSSVIVATAPVDPGGSLDGMTLAINEQGSWSGNHALRVHLADRPSRRFDRMITTGSHEASIDLLLDGGADVAAIDDTIWEFRAARDERLARLHVIDRTRAWPAPPFTVDRRLPAETAAALTAALVGATPAGLDRITPATDSDYDPIRNGMATSRAQDW